MRVPTTMGRTQREQVRAAAQRHGSDAINRHRPPTVRSRQRWQVSNSGRRLEGLRWGHCGLAGEVVRSSEGKH